VPFAGQKIIFEKAEKYSAQKKIVRVLSIKTRGGYIFSSLFFKHICSSDSGRFFFRKNSHKTL
jgi:hypothetical protein